MLLLLVMVELKQLLWLLFVAIVGTIQKKKNVAIVGAIDDVIIVVGDGGVEPITFLI